MPPFGLVRYRTSPLPFRRLHCGDQVRGATTVGISESGAGPEVSGFSCGACNGCLQAFVGSFGVREFMPPCSRSSCVRDLMADAEREQAPGFYSRQHLVPEPQAQIKLERHLRQERHGRMMRCRAPALAREPCGAGQSAASSTASNVMRYQSGSILLFRSVIAAVRGFTGSGNQVVAEAPCSVGVELRRGRPAP